MAKKEKKVSINKLESIMNPITITVPLDGAPDVDVVIRRTLPLSDVLQFVANVVAACIDEETGEYTPEVLPFAIKANVLATYANFNLPSNIEKQYELLYNTGAVEQVMSHINMVQYEEIVNAIDQKINYTISMMTNAVANQVSVLARRMEDFANKSDALFSGVSGEDMSALMHNLSSIGNVDERALVHAVFNEQRQGDVIGSDATLEPVQEKILAFPHTDSNPVE